VEDQVKNARWEGRQTAEDMCTEEVEMAAQFVNDNRSSLLPLLAKKQNFLQTELTGIWLPFAFLVAYPSLYFSSPELNIKDVFKDLAVLVNCNVYFGHRNAFFS